MPVLCIPDLHDAIAATGRQQPTKRTQGKPTQSDGFSRLSKRVQQLPGGCIPYFHRSISHTYCVQAFAIGGVGDIADGSTAVTRERQPLSTGREIPNPDCAVVSAGYQPCPIK